MQDKGADFFNLTDAIFSDKHVIALLAADIKTSDVGMAASVGYALA
jgi:hypothetical protein